MLVPSIKFTEQNTGTVPILAGVRNRIGILGQFSRGPANIARFIGGYTDFSTTYGSDVSPGSLGFQAAYDQGATNFMACRVLGHAVPASGSVTISGVATKVNTLYANFSFISYAIDQNTSSAPLATTVVTGGEYTGSVTGRYYLYVSAIATGVATVKYQFVPEGGTLVAWAGIVTSFAVTLASDGGDLLPIAAGVTVAFGAPSAPINLAVGNTVSIKVNNYVFAAPVNVDDIPLQIATSLNEALSGNIPFASTTVDGGTLVFNLDESYIPGALGNKVFYSFSLQDTVSPGISVTNTGPSSVAMQGGVDGPKIAYRDFYSYSGVPLLRIEAANEGVWGNDLNISIVPVTSSSFKITVSDGNGSGFNPRIPDESWIVSFNNVDTVSGTYQLTDLVRSNLIKAYFLPQYYNPTGFDTSLINKPPLRLAAPNASVVSTASPAFPGNFGPTYLTEVPLLGGYDGPAITDNDYIDALKKFESQPVHIIFTPGLYQSAFVKQALITHCELADVNEGLRIAVLNAPPFLSPNAAKSATKGFRSDRAVMVTGWATYAGQPNAPRFGLSPDAIYAGKLANIGFWIQPQAVSSSGPAVNIVETDNQNLNSTAILQVFTDAKLEILTLSNTYQAFYLVNGQTLDNSGVFSKVSTRRTLDIIEMDVNDSLKSYQSEPHTFQLRRKIATGITTYLSEKLARNQIANYTTPICDSTNNPSSGYSNGEVNVSFSFLDIAAADYINVTVSRDNTLGLAQVGIS